MQHRRWVWTLPALLAAILTACNDCDRSGCDALTRMAPQDGSSIAGVVAQQSDVAQDGCTECPLGSATLFVWTLQEPFERRSEAAELASARAPDLTIDVAGSYRQTLAPGWYLLAARPNAVELNIHEQETLTVNVLRRDGPTSFFVGKPSTGPLQEDFGFDVGLGPQITAP